MQTLGSSNSLTGSLAFIGVALPIYLVGCHALRVIVTAGGLSLPATVQHFLVWRDPDHYFGAGKPFGRQLLTYDLQTLATMEFLQTDAHPGDVALTADNLIAPVLALTKCRVPVGYFSSGL